MNEQFTEEKESPSRFIGFESEGTLVYVSAYKGGPCVLDQMHMVII